MNKFDHLGVYVKDLEASLKFYKSVFDLKEVRRFGSGEAKIGVLDVGGGFLELISRPGSPGTPPGGNWSHLAFHVDDFDYKVKKLESMGKELRKVKMGDGSHIAFFKDDDGHTVEIMEKGLAG